MTYSILDRDMLIRRPMEAEPIKINGYPNFEFFIGWQPYDCAWVVTEKVSGHYLGFSRQNKETAIIDAECEIEENHDKFLLIMDILLSWWGL